MLQFRPISSSFLPRRVPQWGALLPAWVQLRGVLRGGCSREGPHGQFGAVDGPLGILKAIACVCQMGKPKPKERKGLAHSRAVRLSQSQWASASPFVKERNKYPLSGTSPTEEEAEEWRIAGVPGAPQETPCPLTPSILVPGTRPSVCQLSGLSLALFPPHPLLHGGNGSPPSSQTSSP